MKAAMTDQKKSAPSKGSGITSVILLILLLTAAPLLSVSADESLRLVLHDHHFTPDRLEVPAGVKFRLIVKNDSDKTIEWESDELDREEVIKPGEEDTVFLGPLESGTYPYFDDRHQESKGVLVAK
jgi:hypothetical protein